MGGRIHDVRHQNGREVKDRGQGLELKRQAQGKKQESEEIKPLPRGSSLEAGAKGVEGNPKSHARNSEKNDKGIAGNSRNVTALTTIPGGGRAESGIRKKEIPEGRPKA